MKILFLSHQAEFIYGGEICTLAFMKGLQEKGLEVHFASPPGPYQERAKAIGVQIHTIPSIQFSRKLHLLPRLLPALVKTHRVLRSIIAKEQISLVHTTSLKAMAYAWRLSRHIPVLWHHHDILPLNFRNNVWVRALSSQVRILTPSAATRQALLDAGVEEQKVFVLSNGFSTSEWKCRPPREKLALRILLLGEISLRKGSDLLPEIITSLRALHNESFEFLVVGEGLSDPRFAESLREKLAPEVAKGVVKFLGRREDVKDILQTIDVLLVPSRQDPLPTVIVEAHLSGVPVIGSPVGGIPEMIVPGKNGFLAVSPLEFAQKISILAPLDVWNRMSQTSHEMAVNRYEVRTLCDQLLRHYESLKSCR